MSERHKIGTLQQIAAIPQEALPRFLAELPAILQSVRDVTEAAPVLGEQMKVKAPWPLRLMPASVFQRVVERGVTSASQWIDDDKGTASVSMRVKASDEPFFRAETKMGDPA